MKLKMSQRHLKLNSLNENIYYFYLFYYYLKIIVLKFSNHYILTLKIINIKKNRMSEEGKINKVSKKSIEK